MIDVSLLRKDPEAFKRAAAQKGFSIDIDELLRIDRAARALRSNVETLRQSRNSLSVSPRDEGVDDKELRIAKAKQVNSDLAEAEHQLSAFEAELGELLLKVPGIPAPEVPVGESEADNVEVKRWGSPPVFDFPPLDHMQLASMHKMVDVDKSRKFAGTRSYALMGWGARLHLAILQLAVDIVRERGFTPVVPPVLVREKALVGTGFFPNGRDDTYSLPDDGQYLVGTSEVSLIALHSDETMSSYDLPIRYVGVSPCFRREAGAASRDTRGLYRVHTFYKVEQVSIGPNDEAWADQEHHRLLENSEAILQALEIPYRVALACTAELGLGQSKKHEVESWMPSRNAFSETHSCSTLLDFQSRRAGIKYKDTSGKSKFAFTLNNTAIASPRILIPFLENHQQKDGSIRIPAQLQKYLGGTPVIG